jgi:hypothetical protein
MKDWWLMPDRDLELEARKYPIGEYGDTEGHISRKVIIDQLLVRENARNLSYSRLSMLVSVGAALVSVLVTLGNLLG